MQLREIGVYKYLKKVFYLFFLAGLFVGMPLLAVASMPAHAENNVSCCHFSPAAATRQSRLPQMHLTNNRQPMLLILLESEAVQFRTSYLTDEFPTTTSFWSNMLFGEDGDTVNSYFREVSHDFNLQFIPPTFVDENGNKTDGLFIKNPANNINWIRIQDNVVHIQVTEFDLMYVGTQNASRLVRAIWSFIDCSSIPRNNIHFPIDPDILPPELILALTQYGIFAEDLQIYFIRAGGSLLGQSGYAAPPTRNIAGHHRPVSVSYAIGPENKGDMTGFMAQIGYATHLESSRPSVGIFAHEIGHALGLPDLYSLNDGSDLGFYTIMSSSSEATHFGPWEKEILGFVEPEVVSVYPGMTPVVLDLHSIDTPDPFNTIRVESYVNSYQYFLLENRQLVGFDAGLRLNRPTGENAEERGGILTKKYFILMR